MNENLRAQDEVTNVVFNKIINPLPGLTLHEKIRMRRKFDDFTTSEKARFIEKLQTKLKDKNLKRFLLSYFDITSYLDNEYCDDDDFVTSHSGDIDVDLVKRDGKIYRRLTSENSSASLKTIPPNRINKREYKTLENLDNLTGLSSVKSQVRSLIAHTEISNLRAKHGLKANRHGLHMMFKGNPGTGKTTVARLLGAIFKEIGVLSSGHVVEIDRSSLVSKYQGEFEAHVKKYVDQATGGILFIDEIYALFDDSESKNDQSNKGIPVLLKLIEDKREDFICIGAGYEDEVNSFLESNPGLKSRFPIHLNFEDYTIEELVKIASDMFESEDYKMEEDFIVKLKECLEEEKQQEDFGNARTVRNIAESSIRCHSLRLFNGDFELTKENLMNIKGEDFQYVPLRIEKKNKNKDKMEEFAEKLMEKMSNNKEEKGE